MKRTATRRAFLIGASGLCLGSAGVIWLRRTLRTAASLSPYSAFDVDLQQVRSDLSADQIEEAFDILFRERDMWLRFRGLSAAVQVQTEVVEPAVEVQRLEHQGRVSLQLTELPDSRLGMLAYESELTYSDLPSGASWKYVTNREKNLRFEGDKIPGVDHMLLFAVLYVNMQLFSDMPNLALRQSVGTWNPVVNPQAKGVPGSYRFEESGPKGKFMKLAFENGHISEYHSKREPGASIATVLMRQPTLSNGIWYPTEIEGSVEQPSSKKRLKCVLRLSDLNVTAA